MIQTITIAIKPAVLLSSNVSEPIPYCTVEVTGQPEVFFFYTRRMLEGAVC